MTYAILMGLMALLWGGLNNVMSKFLVREVGPARGAFFRNVFLVPMAVILVLFSLNGIKFDAGLAVILFLVYIVGYLPFLFFNKAIQTGEVGVVATIASTRIIITTLVAFIFLQQAVSLGQVGAILLIIVGIALISASPRDFKKFMQREYLVSIKFALFAALGWGVLFVIWGWATRFLSPSVNTLLIETGTLAGASLNIWATVPEKFQVQRPILKKALLFGFLWGLFGFLNTITLNLGFATGQVGLVTSLSAASPLSTALFALVLFKEKLNARQWLAILVIICGVIGITLLR